jgi:uncharacterized protein YlzI (FlbEa/FlbD family)
MKFVELKKSSGETVLVGIAHIVKVSASPGISNPKTTIIELADGQPLTVIGDYDEVKNKIQS